MVNIKLTSKAVTPMATINSTKVKPLRQLDFSGLASKKWTPNQAALMFNFSYLSSKATGEI
jgi:hypothetical protein